MELLDHIIFLLDIYYLFILFFLFLLPHVIIAEKWLDLGVYHNEVIRTICSDSSAVLKSLHSFKSQARQDIIYEILELHSWICQMGITVKFTWVPAHVGVKGSEMVDRMAKQASKHEEVDIVITITSKAEAKAQIWTKINKQWQAHWDAEEKERHLYNIQTKVWDREGHWKEAKGRNYLYEIKNRTLWVK